MSGNETLSFLPAVYDYDERQIIRGMYLYNTEGVFERKAFDEIKNFPFLSWYQRYNSPLFSFTLHFDLIERILLVCISGVASSALLLCRPLMLRILTTPIMYLFLNWRSMLGPVRATENGKSGKSNSELPQQMWYSNIEVCYPYETNRFRKFCSQ